MSLADVTDLLACPACAVAPMAMAAAQTPDDDAQRLILSLPHIHCAACITAIESALMALPGVSAARVNLTRKRATIHAAPGIDADTLIAALARIGHEAHELDGDALSSGDHDAQVALVGDWNIAPQDDDVWDISLFAHSTHVTEPEHHGYENLWRCGLGQVWPQPPGRFQLRGACHR